MNKYLIFVNIRRPPAKIFEGQNNFLGPINLPSVKVHNEAAALDCLNSSDGPGRQMIELMILP